MTHRKTTSVDELYSKGRSFPRGQNRDPQSQQTIRHEPPFADHEVQGNQFFEDAHDRGYDGQPSGWVRGARGEPTMQNETATNYPNGNFDRENSWRLGREASLTRGQRKSGG
jgi:hypothetical protein